MKRLLIAANRLPLYILTSPEGPDIKPSDELKYSGLDSFYRQFHTRWIGVAGDPESDDLPEEHRLEPLLQEFRCFPVWVDKDQYNSAIHGFAERTLWPLFHYVPSKAQYRDEEWEAYVELNKTYAKKLGKMLREGDYVWIHDYHLLLLPAMIRALNINVSVGLFVHIPFPSFEIFRLLPWREEILNGMMGADLIGFQVFDYVRHMMSCVRRILGVDTVFNRIMIGERTLKADVFPKGIDYERLASKTENGAVLQDAETQKIVAEIRQQYPKRDGHKYIISVDPVDYTKGIPQRLKAYEMFLSRWPEYVEKVTLLLITMPFEKVESRDPEIFHEVNEWVGRLNGTYSTLSWTPVVFISQTLTPEELVALYAHADIALVVPFRDGMNMTAKEFVAAHNDQGGVLILSELAGASRELHEGLIVNPNNLNEVSESILEALKMPIPEQKRRMQMMNQRLKKYPVQRWAREFITALDGVKELQEVKLTKKVTQGRISQILKAYQGAKKRICFLDYDGTLSGFTKNPQDAKPDETLYTILRNLTSDPHNRVVIISGRDKETLSEWFDDGWPIHFVAEHGVWLKEPGGAWHMMEQIDRDWKSEVFPLLDYYVDQTPKSFIEEKNFSLVWHYRKSDPDLGIQRAWELKEQLRGLTANLNLEIMDGDKVLEIKYSGVNKGRAAQMKLAQDHFDFILAIGDDWTDEYTFEAMPPEAFTIKVGTKTTKAGLYVESVEDVRNLLSILGERS